jgi:hypothetical protein
VKRATKIRRVTCPECDAAPGARCMDGVYTRDANHQARVKAHQKAFPPIPRGEAPAGVLAWFDGDCARCPERIQRHVHQVVQRKGSWIHTSCASGSRDGEAL